MGKTYKNIIFTSHAYNRTKERSIPLHAVYETIVSPDKTKQVGNGKKKYFKTIRDRRYQVVATYKSDQKKYLIISNWVRGEDDKVPLVWQLITLPFKLVWMILKLLFSIVKKLW